MNKVGLSFLLSVFLIAQAHAEVSTLGDVQPVQTKAQYGAVLEADTGEMLFAKDGDVKMPTSSMSKVMTMYLVFEAIKEGKLSLDTTLTVSKRARAKPGSRMFLKAGQKVKVEDLIKGVIVQSGNDASVVLAEAVAGTEGSFAGLMNDKARELGLKNTHFMNATGLPDPEHYSTAEDLAQLSLALVKDFPEYYYFYSIREFKFNKIKQGNRNPLLYRDIGVDGIKTGHTQAAGYGLISSALRNGRRIIAVLNGMNSMQERADESAKVLDWAYREFGLYTVLEAGKKAGEAKVWLGQTKTVPVGLADDMRMSLPRMQRDDVKMRLMVDSEIEAPIAKGQKVGMIVITAAGHPAVTSPVVALQDVEKLGFFSRILAKAKRLLGRK